MVMLIDWWRRLVRFGFRLLYHEMAWSYDAVSWLVSLGAWRAWQRAALPFVAGRRVLELGHGPGHMLLALQLAGYRVAGLDLSPQMGRLARRRAPSVPLIRGRVQALPLADGCFDTVLATFPTDYVVDPVTLREVARVLAPDGRFVIVPDGRLTGGGRLARGLEWLFWLTGQRPHRHQPEDLLWAPLRRRLAAAGLSLAVTRRALPGSQVTVLVCRRTGP